MSLLTVFRRQFVGSLRANIDVNLGQCRRDDQWINELGSSSVRDLNTRIELRGALELDEPDAENLEDLENAIRIHRYLQGLTPLQARDPRLWTRLTHVEGWAYMRKRWPVERFAGKDEKAARFVASRYFIAQSDSRALLRNGMARLWWTAQMSFDPTRSNPYELTAVLLHRLDITQQILERNMGRAPVVNTAFLEFILQNKDILLSGGERNRVRIRKLAVGLNLYGGVCLLDCLSQMELLDVLRMDFRRILASENTL